MTPYTLHPGTTLLLAPRYWGSIAWYAAMAAHENVIVDYRARHDKRLKLTHRTTLADVNGPLSLTMPLSRPAERDRSQGPLRWSDMLVSPHDEWWNIHRVTLESAYGRTPFFEFYIDRFLPALTAGVIDRFPTLEAIDTFIDHRVREILGLPLDVGTPTGEIIDLRDTEPTLDFSEPYYQVRSSRLGFIPGLSIMDLLFNMGPESALWLRRAINK